MGPTIILDKSTLQSLSHEEIVCLGNYYLVIVAPILISEILGNLKKGVEDENSISKDKVITLAGKLHSRNLVINEFYFPILIGSLFGENVKMDGRPTLGGARYVKNKEGKIGLFFEETPEKKAMNNWKDGKFSEEEKILSQRWRDSTRNVDLEKISDEFKETLLYKENLNNFDDVLAHVENILSHELYQNNLLKVLMFETLVPPEDASKIFMRWEQGNFKYIRDFSEYAYFYLKVNWFFYLSLSNNLIGTRPTNRVDLEYLYYLPFTNVFSSGDKFHKKITPYLLRENQLFIPAKDLKNDLSKLNEQVKKNNKEAKYPLWPPEIGGITNELWKNFMKPPTPGRSEDLLSKMSDEEKEKLLEKLKSFTSDDLSDFTSYNSFPDVDDPNVEFVTINRQVRLSDPCPCGSGKPLKDCHYKGKNS